MSGLSGFLFGIGATVISFILFLISFIYSLLAKKPNIKIVYASASAFVTMLGYIGFLYIADDKHLINFPNKYYDVLGPGWTIAAVMIALYVLVKK